MKKRRTLPVLLKPLVPSGHVEISETLEELARGPRAAVADTPGHIPPFRSSILPRGRALTYPTQRLFARLYLEGLSSGNFEPAFRELLGSRTPLSPSTILRLKADWRAEYTVCRTRGAAAA
jgi:hypothetical protein